MYLFLCKWIIRCSLREWAKELMANRWLGLFRCLQHLPASVLQNMDEHCPISDRLWEELELDMRFYLFLLFSAVKIGCLLLAEFDRVDLALKLCLRRCRFWFGIHTWSTLCFARLKRKNHQKPNTTSLTCRQGSVPFTGKLTVIYYWQYYW